MQIPIPDALAAQAQDLQSLARRIAVICDRFSTEGKLEEARALLADLRRAAGPTQMQINAVLKEERDRARKASQEAARAEALNARIRAEREDAA
jgi:hypothetical protein